MKNSIRKDWKLIESLIQEKSKVLDIKINKTKLIIVKKKVLGNFFSFFQGFLKDK